MASKKRPVKKKKDAGKFKKFLIALIVISAAGLLIAISDLYKKIYFPNVSLKETKETYIYIHTGSSYEDVFNMLVEKQLLTNYSSFDWVASHLDYKEHIHPGRYLIKKNMNNKDLVLLLRSAKQTPVKLTFNSIRTKDQFISRISHELEVDSLVFSDLLNDPEFVAKYGFNNDNILCMFIPNTYELYWNISAESFVEKMNKEYKKFWTKDKIQKAEDAKLTPVQASILASIVEQETQRKDERDMVAGVYMNRLKKGYKLEADPTLVYALGDFTIKRVLNVYKKIDSPYNTYMYTGLPPGPICMPSVASIKAVLNHKKHDYFYFCAKEDFTGYHCFAKNYSEHQQNARRYQKELNKRKIKM